MATQHCWAGRAGLWFNTCATFILTYVLLELTIRRKKYRFHAEVNRCYSPSEEVANRAALHDLHYSQICVFGLPIRPSLCRAVLVKVFSSP
jgi:hypothetical protein